MSADTLAEPRLDDQERALFERGLAHFNRGEYFECHDALEELWSGLRGPGRDFFQGLIQIAVAFYHLGAANPAGARSLFARAATRLAAYPGDYLGFDLTGWRDELRKRAHWLAAGQLALAAQDPPAWRLRAADGHVTETSR